MSVYMDDANWTDDTSEGAQPLGDLVLLCCLDSTERGEPLYVRSRERDIYMFWISESKSTMLRQFLLRHFSCNDDLSIAVLPQISESHKDASRRPRKCHHAYFIPDRRPSLRPPVPGLMPDEQTFHCGFKVADHAEAAETSHGGGFGDK